MTKQELDALKYPNFTLEYIKNRVMYPQFFTRGKNYYSNGYVTELYFDEAANRFNATVRGNYYYSCTLTFRSGKLTYHRCDCPAHDSYDGPCKHIVAVMLEIYYRRKEALKKLKTENNSTAQAKKDFTDTISDNTKKQFTQTTIKPQTTYTPQQPKIDITPHSQTSYTPPPKEKPQETKPKRKRLRDIDMSFFWKAILIVVAINILPLAFAFQAESFFDGVSNFFYGFIGEFIIVGIIGGIIAFLN